jgi:hypothetical protein
MPTLDVASFVLGGVLILLAGLGAMRVLGSMRHMLRLTVQGGYRIAGYLQRIRAVAPVVPRSGASSAVRGLSCP